MIEQWENSGQLQNNISNGAMLKTINCVINQVIQYFLTSCFFFFYKNLNAPGHKITCLWNFCHLFPVFYDWKKSINDSFWFLGFFSRNHFLKGGFTFQWGRGGGCFSDGGWFLSGGHPIGAIGFDGCFSKNL